MGSFTVGEILVDAALLGILLVILGDHGGSRDGVRRFGAVGGIAVGLLLLDLLWGAALGWWILAPQALLAVGVLSLIARVGSARAALITTLFFAVKVALRLALNYVMSPE